MPSFNIHLAIANRYIEKHNVENKEDFLTGSIAPDFAEKAKSHYSKIIENSTLEEELKNKVIIENFLKENKVETDYDKGVFLHLLTDKIFFTEFFPKEYIENVEHNEFCKNLYFSYDKSNEYLVEKYHVQFPKKYEKEIEKNIQDNIKAKKYESGGEVCIIPIDKLDKFIEGVSDVNLDEYSKKYNNTSNFAKV